MFRLLEELCDQNILCREGRGFSIRNVSALEHIVYDG